MQLRQFQIDAFSAQVFAGNPAAVVPLAEWLPDHALQAIANENQLSETAFFVPQREDYALRWFTPTREVALCGHATLATAHVLFHHIGVTAPRIAFHTMSGVLHVARDGNTLWMDFPAQPAEPCATPEALTEGLGVSPEAVLSGEDWMVVLADAAAVDRVEPDFNQLQQLDRRGVIVTAVGAGPVDFVSRFFAPRYGIPEDPVTGSAHCAMAPYWSSRLGKSALIAEQRSRRGGRVQCLVRDGRVKLGGEAVTFLEGQITIPDA